MTSISSATAPAAGAERTAPNQDFHCECMILSFVPSMLGGTPFLSPLVPGHTIEQIDAQGAQSRELTETYNRAVNLMVGHSLIELADVLRAKSEDLYTSVRAGVYIADGVGQSTNGLIERQEAVIDAYAQYFIDLDHLERADLIPNNQEYFRLKGNDIPLLFEERFLQILQTARDVRDIVRGEGSAHSKMLQMAELCCQLIVASRFIEAKLIREDITSRIPLAVVEGDENDIQIQQLQGFFVAESDKILGYVMGRPSPNATPNDYLAASRLWSFTSDPLIRQAVPILLPKAIAAICKNPTLENLEVALTIANECQNLELKNTLFLKIISELVGKPETLTFESVQFLETRVMPCLNRNLPDDQMSLNYYTPVCSIALGYDIVGRSQDSARILAQVPEREISPARNAFIFHYLFDLGLLAPTSIFLKRHADCFSPAECDDYHSKLKFSIPHLIANNRFKEALALAHEYPDTLAETNRMITLKQMSLNDDKERNTNG